LLVAEQDIITPGVTGATVCSAFVAAVIEPRALQCLGWPFEVAVVLL
jgi:hypothetical protein